MNQFTIVFIQYRQHLSHIHHGNSTLSLEEAGAQQLIWNLHHSLVWCGIRTVKPYEKETRCLLTPGIPPAVASHFLNPYLSNIGNLFCFVSHFKNKDNYLIFNFHS